MPQCWTDDRVRVGPTCNENGAAFDLAKDESLYTRPKIRRPVLAVPCTMRRICGDTTPQSCEKEVCDGEGGAKESEILTFRRNQTLDARYQVLTN